MDLLMISSNSKQIPATFKDKPEENKFEMRPGKPLDLNPKEKISEA